MLTRQPRYRARLKVNCFVFTTDVFAATYDEALEKTRSEVVKIKRKKRTDNVEVLSLYLEF